MNKKVTGFVLASVLATPLMMANISRADGDGGRGGKSLEFEKSFCLPATTTPPAAASGGKVKCLATDSKGEAEVEYSQKTKNGITKTKLNGEVELKVPAIVGVAGAIPTLMDVDITITPLLTPAVTLPLPIPATFGNPFMCTFTNPPTVKDVFNKAVPPVLVATKVEFHGSLSQTQTPDPVAIPPAPTTITTTVLNGLDCGTAQIPTLLKGSMVVVGVGAFEVSGKLKKDD